MRPGKVYLAMDCGLYLFDESGESWTKIGDVPPNVSPTALTFVSPDDVYIGTDQGLFRAKNISSVNGSSTEGQPENGSVMVSVAPNPVRDEGTISITLQENSYLRVVLYDHLGRVVRELAEGSYYVGKHDIQLDVMLAGTYIVAVEAEGELTSRRIIVLPE